MSTMGSLLTGSEQLRDFHRAITPAPQIPSRPPNRRMRIHGNNLVGQSLIYAKTPWELCIAIGHGMLGAYQLWSWVSQRLTCRQGGCRC